MSRLMHGDEAVAYRAVIVETHEGGSEPKEYVTFVGPYVTVGTAKAAITWAVRKAERYGRWGIWGTDVTVTGHVEKSSIVWERVDG